MNLLSISLKLDGYFDTLCIIMLSYVYASIVTGKTSRLSPASISSFSPALLFSSLLICSFLTSLWNIYDEPDQVRRHLACVIANSAGFTFMLRRYFKIILPSKVSVRVKMLYMVFWMI